MVLVVIFIVIVLYGFIYYFFDGIGNILKVTKSQFIEYCIEIYKYIVGDVIKFITTWGLTQWISSIVGLLILYGLVLYIFRKTLQKRGMVAYKNIDLKLYVLMCSLDLWVNLLVGMSAMYYRHLVWGQLMLQCPISISPFIFIVEFIVLIYVVWDRRNIKKK